MSETKYLVGIYCRLSQEDGNDESQSIKTQKEIILSYVKQREWKVVDIYSDDGYSGTNFNRPEFNRLISDIKAGKINLVITKDLSRLGRNYIQAGYYTEEFFPEHNVRYIALGDNFDSLDEDSCDFAPFKNIINEWYAKDISKKIRFTLDGKAKSGQPRNTVFPIFGYAYNELYERVPDPETAEIVKTIYEKYIEYASTTRVANYLKEQGVYVPSFYNAVKYGYNKAKILAKPKETHTAWTSWMIRDVIIKDAYLGTYRTAQTKGISFKNRKRRKNDNCYVFERRYKALVDRETWLLANSLLKRNNSGTVLVEDNEFKGLLYCGDCGQAMRVERHFNKKNNTFDYRYYCNNKQCNYCNSISKKTIEILLLKEIEHFKECMKCEQELTNYFKQDKVVLTSNTVDIQRAIEKVKKNIEKIEKKIIFILEQYTEGLLTDSSYYSLLGIYKKEKQLFDDELAKLSALKLEESHKSFIDASGVVKKIFSAKPEIFLKHNFLIKLINNIYIRCEHIDGSKHNRNITLTIKYNTPAKLTHLLKNEK